MPRGLALVAVGGYGRGELFPHSDVDVLILLPQAADGAGTPFIERFFAALWDIGLELAHSVRTIEECETEMAHDVTIRTSLLEHRFLHGSRPLYRHFARASPERLDVRAFYDAKALEQQQRHLRHQDTAYNLEPNVKESPGGLRDLQTIIWIARAAGLGQTWRELARNGLMTIGEARAVSRQERFIGAMRVRLHYLAGPARGSPGVRPADGARETATPRRHAAPARQRAADAALLPRRQARCARSTSSCCRTCMRGSTPPPRRRSRSTTISRRSTSCSTSATTICSRFVPPRCSTRS